MKLTEGIASISSPAVFRQRAAEVCRSSHEQKLTVIYQLICPRPDGKSGRKVIKISRSKEGLCFASE